MDTNVIFLNLWSYMDTWNIKEYSKTTMCGIGPPLCIVGLKIMSSTLAYNVLDLPKHNKLSSFALQ